MKIFLTLLTVLALPLWVIKTAPIKATIQPDTADIMKETVHSTWPEQEEVVPDVKGTQKAREEVVTKSLPQENPQKFQFKNEVPAAPSENTQEENIAQTLPQETAQINEHSVAPVEENTQYGILTQEINKIRKRNGISPVKEVAEVNAIACTRLAQVKVNFSHDGWKIQSDAYNEGELLFSSSDTNDIIGTAIQLWLNSDTHRTTLLSSKYTEHGYCIGDGYIVSRFRSPR